MATSIIKNPIIQTSTITCDYRSVNYCIGSIPNYDSNLKYVASITGGTSHGMGVTREIQINKVSGNIQCISDNFSSDDNVIVDVIGIKW